MSCRHQPAAVQAQRAAAAAREVLVTHDEHLAARCRHQIRLDSGRLVQPVAVGA